MAFLSRKQKLLQSAFLTYARYRRGMTLGVRTMVFGQEAKQESVLLVKHTYVNGWYFPGGAIDPGEDAFTAAARELVEEAGIELTASPQMVGLYQNAHASKRDHVAFFHCRDWLQGPRPKIPNREIVAAEFFALNNLPDDISPGTMRRIVDYQQGNEAPAIW